MKNVRCDTVTLSPSLSFPFCAPLTLFPLFLGVEPLSGKSVQCCEYEHRATPSNIFFSTQLLKMRLASFFYKGKGNFEDWIGRLILPLHNVRIDLEVSAYFAMMLLLTLDRSTCAYSIGIIVTVRVVVTIFFVVSVSFLHLCLIY